MYDQHPPEPFASYRLPRPKAPAISPGSFVLYPVAWLPAGSSEQEAARQWVYQWAFEQARAVLRPSLPERDLLGVWN